MSGLAHRGLTLDSATSDDLAFLRDLYASTRAEEVARMPWHAAAAARFLDGQFALQHDHFVTHHPTGDFLIVRHRGEPVGRLYCDRSSPIWRLLDIALVPSVQGRGVGTALLRGLQRAARGAGATGIDLHVRFDNGGAMRIYRRLGFTDAIAASGTHLRMIWSPLRQLKTA